MTKENTELTATRRTWMLQDLKEAGLVSETGVPSAYGQAIASGMSQEDAARPWNKYGSDITKWPHEDAVRYWNALHSVSDGKTQGEIVEAVWRACAEREYHLFTLLVRKTDEAGLTAGVKGTDLDVTAQGMSLLTGIPVEKLGERLPHQTFLLAAENTTGAKSILSVLYILARDKKVIK